MENSHHRIQSNMQQQQRQRRPYTTTIYFISTHMRALTHNVESYLINVFNYAKTTGKLKFRILILFLLWFFFVWGRGSNRRRNIYLGEVRNMCVERNSDSERRGLGREGKGGGGGGGTVWSIP